MKPELPPPPDTEGVDNLLAPIRQVPEWPAQKYEKIWSEAEARASKSSGFAGWLLVPVAAAALLVIVAGVSIARRGPKIDLGNGAIAEVTRGSDFTPSPGELSLRNGSARVTGATRVKTPKLAEELSSGSAFVQVAGETTVQVESGEASAFASSGAVKLRAGESLRSDDPRLLPPPEPPKPVAPPQPKVEAPPVDTCAAQPKKQQRACYAGQSGGSDLAAQNAQFRLGVVDRDGHDLAAAVDDWRTYLRRFPYGALAPEASFEMIGALISSGRYDDAKAQCDFYLVHFGAELRRPEVHLERGQLLMRANKPAEAVRDFRAVEQFEDVTDAVRSEAIFWHASALDKEGLHVAAKQWFHNYAHRYPQGPHAKAAARLAR